MQNNDTLSYVVLYQFYVYSKTGLEWLIPSLAQNIPTFFNETELDEKMESGTHLFFLELEIFPAIDLALQNLNQQQSNTCQQNSSATWP